MKRALAIICTLLASAACQRSADRQEQETAPSLLPPPATEQGTQRTEPSQVEPGTTAPATSAEERQPMAGKDETSAGTTPGAQDQSSADRALLQRVREAITSDNTLSASAKNVTIDAKEGVVTLSGPVQSDEEKSRVEDMIEKVEGVKRVENQLKVND